VAEKDRRKHHSAARHGAPLRRFAITTWCLGDRDEGHRMIPRVDLRSSLETRADLQTPRAVIQVAAPAARLHARRHLDARVLRRRLHGDVPFVFR